MDRVRYADVVQVFEVTTVELFPNISIGDAPELVEAAAPAANATNNGGVSK